MTSDGEPETEQAAPARGLVLGPSVLTLNGVVVNGCRQVALPVPDDPAEAEPIRTGLTQAGPIASLRVTLSVDVEPFTAALRTLRQIFHWHVFPPSNTCRSCCRECNPRGNPAPVPWAAGYRRKTRRRNRR